MKDFKAIAKEMRFRLEQAICIGPVGSMDERLKGLLDDFESSIVAYADDEAIRRASAYYKQLEGATLDGEPVFDKDKAVDSETPKD